MPLAGLDHAVMEAVQALWSQGAHIFFAAASFLGEAGFLVALVVACWWCLDRDLGEYLIFAQKRRKPVTDGQEKEIVAAAFSRSASINEPPL